nr:integrase, catalytic region, zinc finger, CCHC-type, peptidase aspartic, catalytic [Tanacetum cinerariifolium]
MTEDRSRVINFVKKFLGTVKFGNDHVVKIRGYGDYKIGNVTILRVYFVEGLGHNLFSVGQFCDSDLEVAFCQHTCFIHNLDGIDLLTGSRGNNLYTLSLGDMMASSPICLLSKASKTKSWIWHRRLSHLNFGAINHLARQGLVRVRLKVPVRRIQTDNGTEFVNQTLREHYEQIGISHETLFARSLQQNGVVERHKHTLIEVARTIRTKRLVETIHVDFNELTVMASEQSSSGPALNEMTPATISSGLVPKPSFSIPYVPPSRNDWDLLFQPLFDELLTPPPSVDPPDLEVIALIADVIPLVQVESTGLPSSTTVDKDAPSPSKSQTTPETQSLVIPQDVEKDIHDIEFVHMRNDPLFGFKSIQVTYSTMDMTIDQQVALDEALVPHASRLRIGKSNFRLKSDISSKESTFQLAYDFLRLTPFYKAFLITVDVPEIYMQEFWATTMVHHHSISGEIRRLTDVNINKLHQPWRSFASIINKCLSGKSTGYDSLRLSQAQTLWGLYHKRNVDFAYLLWEDFIYQVEHKDAKKSNEMYYPRFIKVIIHFFMSKDPSILRRNKVNWNYVRDDQVFTTIKLVSRHQNTQQLGAMLPIELTNEDIRNSKAYKEYYAVATEATPPKTKASLRKTKSSFDTTVTPSTATAGTRLSTSVKGKQPAKASKAKCLTVLSEVAMTEAE